MHRQTGAQAHTRTDVACVLTSSKAARGLTDSSLICFCQQNLTAHDSKSNACVIPKNILCQLCQNCIAFNVRATFAMLPSPPFPPQKKNSSHPKPSHKGTVVNCSVHLHMHTVLAWQLASLGSWSVGDNSLRCYSGSFKARPYCCLGVCQERAGCHP